MQITGIILTGGQSTRMGTDKALIQINGNTLLKNAIEICKPVCKEILISSNKKEHAIFGHKIIPDEFKNSGPLSGIYSCLKKSETEWNFVISVDAAFVEPEFIMFLMNETDDFDAVVPFHKKGKEPLIAMFNKKRLSEMKRFLESGNFKMHNLLNTLNVKFVDSQNWVDRFPEIFSNLNHPDDLKLLQKRYI